MTSEYSERLKDIDAHDWDAVSLNVNIPGHPETRFSSPSGKYEVEISPKNGYDDGELHEERLHFFVNVYEYRVDDSGNRLEEDGLLFSGKKKTDEEAVKTAQEKLDNYAQKSDA